MMRFFYSVILFFYISNITAQNIQIGIFNDKNIRKLFLESNKGKYKVFADGKRISKLKGTATLSLEASANGIKVFTNKKDYQSIRNISIKGNKKSKISVKLIQPKQKARIYAGNLVITTKNGQIILINQPPFNSYLAGVVEAESGTRAAKEYYKNQAIICRTYALEKWDKHKSEGFNLCDGVHCQAYKGLATENKLIEKSVKKTKNLVILDGNNRLIEALFSANCGGQTNNSEMVWSSKIPYLRSVKDPYCIDQKQARWEKTIPLNQFKSFLIKKGLSIPDTFKAENFAFKQPERKKYYTINNQKIKLTSIRYGMHLRSTFFNIEPSGKELIFKGRGYGHGVGMCQEGAMNMAKKGKKYADIIKFYYTGVKIKPLSKAVDLPEF